MQAYDSIGGNKLCVRSPTCACSRAYFDCYLTVRFKIRTLESIFIVFSLALLFGGIHPNG